MIRVAILLIFIYLAHAADIACSTDGSKKVVCNGDNYKLDERVKGWVAVGYVAVCIFLVLFAGCMSGLTIGLLSLDPVNLKIISKSGTPQQKKYDDYKQAMEALPIFLDRLSGPILAIILSVTAVLAFGEIIPQAICSRFGLAIGAYLFWLVWLLIAVFFVIAWPVSKLLDCVLGKDHVSFYRRSDLKELIGLHGTRNAEDDEEQESREQEEQLTADEVTIIRGAIDMAKKYAGDCMTPLEAVFRLDFDGVMDYATMKTILEYGHSRIPVYRGEEDNIIGMILTKRLILLNPDDGVPISSLKLVRIPTVENTLPLYDILNMFQTGKSHMAVVVDSNDRLKTLGIVTLEDVLEELIQEEIVDETDVCNSVSSFQPPKLLKYNGGNKEEERRRQSFKVKQLRAKESEEDKKDAYGDEDDDEEEDEEEDEAETSEEEGTPMHDIENPSHSSSSSVATERTPLRNNVNINI